MGNGLWLDPFARHPGRTRAPNVANNPFPLRWTLAAPRSEHPSFAEHVIDLARRGLVEFKLLAVEQKDERATAPAAKGLTWKPNSNSLGTMAGYGLGALTLGSRFLFLTIPDGLYGCMACSSGTHELEQRLLGC